jgi:hypothetical protein
MASIAPPNGRSTMCAPQGACPVPMDSMPNEGTIRDARPRSIVSETTALTTTLAPPADRPSIRPHPRRTSAVHAAAVGGWGAGDRAG